MIMLLIIPKILNAFLLLVPYIKYLACIHVYLDKF